MKSNSENIHIKPSKKKGENKATIVLENDLNIYSINELKEKLTGAYKKHDEIHFDIKNVKNMDLTFVQLIFSIKQEAIKDKKKISFEVDFNEDIKLLLENADINKVFR